MGANAGLVEQVVGEDGQFYYRIPADKQEEIERFLAHEENEGAA
jgi:hypothetical protein